MSWRDMVADIGRQASAVFSEGGDDVDPILHVPTVKATNVNARPGADGTRPSYELCGAFYDPDEGGGRGYDSKLTVGRQVTNVEVRVPTVQPLLHAPACAFTYPPKQDDEFVIPGVGSFRALAILAGAPGMYRITLEKIGRPSMS